MTTIGSAGSNNPLTSSLKAQGLSSDTIKLVESDLQDVLKAGSATTSPGSAKVDAASVRSALDAKLKTDVASGKISQEDADKVTKALDEMDAAAAKGSAPAGGAAGVSKAGGTPAGGGGGRGESEKTELSRTETVADGIKTTVIVYTDGSTETETTVDLTDEDTSKNKIEDAGQAAKADDQAKTASQDKDDPSVSAAYGATGKDGAEGYLATIEPGSLFEILT